MQEVKVEQAWVRPRLDGKSFEVVVHVDAIKGKFIEGVHDDNDDAQARVKVLLRPGTLIEARDLTPAD